MRRTEQHRRRIAERMAIRFGALSMRALDYRYWQAKLCGFDPVDDRVWAWWRRLHWMDREAIVKLSPHWMTREEKAEIRLTR